MATIGTFKIRIFRISPKAGKARRTEQIFFLPWASALCRCFRRCISDAVAKIVDVLDSGDVYYVMFVRDGSDHPVLEAGFLEDASIEIRKNLKTLFLVAV